MDRRSSFARAAASGLLSGLSLVACGATQPSATAPTAPMDPVTAPGAGVAPAVRVRGVTPAPPPLPTPTVERAPRAAREREPVHDKACCRGMNECKGKGGCADPQHDCAGMNDCKGTSTACPPDPGGGGEPTGSP